MPHLSTVPKHLLGSTPAATKAAVRNLYRLWLKEAPRTCTMYLLDIPVSQVKARIRTEFERFADVSDVKVAQMLVIKGHMELDETVNIFKQKTHVMRYFEEPSDVKRDFMTRFLDGRPSLKLTDNS